MDQFAAERYAQELCIRYVSGPRNHGYHCRNALAFSLLDTPKRFQLNPQLFRPSTTSRRCRGGPDFGLRAQVQGASQTRLTPGRLETHHGIEQ